MASYNNNWWNWLRPRDEQSITPSFTPSMYIGGTSTKTGEIITPEKALENPTVYACVTLIAQTVAQLPWGITEKDAVGYVPVDHPVNKLLAMPNAGMVDYELKHQIVVDLLTYGNAYLLKVVTMSGKTVELIPLKPSEIIPVISASGKRSYRHNDNGTIYPSERIIHIRDFIGSTVDGLSKVNQCANLVAIDNAIDSTLASSFRNGTSISGVVSFPDDVPPDMAAAFTEAWSKKFGGNGTSTGSVAILGGGAEFTQIKPLSPADADMRELKQQTMTRIAAVFRVPAYAIEIADGSKYDNLSQRQSGFYRDSIAPILRNIERKLTIALVSEQNLQVEFDSSEIIKGDLQTATDVAVKAVQSNIITVNEARDLLGYPQIDEKEQIPPKVEI